MADDLDDTPSDAIRPAVFTATTNNDSLSKLKLNNYNNREKPEACVAWRLSVFKMFGCGIFKASRQMGFSWQ
mgnify:CR=1 FL=1